MEQWSASSLEESIDESEKADSCHSPFVHLVNEMLSKKEIAFRRKLDIDHEFQALKQTIKQNLKKRLSYLVENEKKVLSTIESNDKLGLKVFSRLYFMIVIVLIYF